MLNQQTGSETVMPFERPAREQSPEELGFRRFVVTDRDYVAVPGCVRVDEVRLGRMIIPASEKHHAPTNTTHKNFKEVIVMNYMLSDGDDGDAILLRGLNSNDGKWQVGAEVFVRGEWEDGQGAKAPAEKPLSRMNTDELLAKAKELEIDVPEGSTKAQIVELIKAKQA